MKTYSVGSIPWIYPCDQAAPAGIKVALLTRGGVQVTGVWRNGGDFIAWQKLFKRDRSKEV